MKRKVVVVDDDGQLLKLMTKIFGRMEFEVFDFPDSQNALEAMGDFGVQIDLLVTDFDMPGMNGAELVKEFKRIYPEIKIICNSGTHSNRRKLSECDFFLKKPFSVKTFKKKVRDFFPS